MSEKKALRVRDDQTSWQQPSSTLGCVPTSFGNSAMSLGDTNNRLDTTRVVYPGSLVPDSSTLPGVPSNRALGALRAPENSSKLGIQQPSFITAADPSSAASFWGTSQLPPTTTDENPNERYDAAPRANGKRHHRDSPERDYSEEIRQLNRKRKRTGQACDRCRVRRFGCDPSPRGCGNCLNLGLECKVTDSVTGETYIRGAAGRIQAEIDNLKSRIAVLEHENERLCSILGFVPAADNPLADILERVMKAP